MMAKSMETLEFHYSMIQIYPIFTSICTATQQELLCDHLSANACFLACTAGASVITVVGSVQLQEPTPNYLNLTRPLDNVRKRNSLLMLWVKS